MPALGFNKQFADDVATGKKRQTVRAPRKREFRKGDRLYLYTGLRTKACRKLGESVCTSATRVQIGSASVREFLTGNELNAEAFASADGFATFAEMAGWFEKTHYGLPFVGVCVKWGPVEHPDA